MATTFTTQQNVDTAIAVAHTRLTYWIKQAIRRRSLDDEPKLFNALEILSRAFLQAFERNPVSEK